MINDRASELPFSTAPPVYLSLKRYGRHRSLKLPPLDTSLSPRLFPRDYFNCFNASTAGQPSLCSDKPLSPRSSIFLLESRNLKSSRARWENTRKRVDSIGKYRAPRRSDIPIVLKLRIIWRKQSDRRNHGQISKRKQQITEICEKTKRSI